MEGYLMVFVDAMRRHEQEAISRPPGPTMPP